MAKYLEGKLIIAFKPEAKDSEIEAVLSRYTHKKFFPKATLDANMDRTDQILARTYGIDVLAGTELDTIKTLQDKYEKLIEYIERAATRKLI